MCGLFQAYHECVFVGGGEYLRGLWVGFSAEGACWYAVSYACGEGCERVAARMAPVKHNESLGL